MVRRYVGLSESIVTAFADMLAICGGENLYA